MLKMIVFSLVALAALQVCHSKACVDNEHVISPLGSPQQPCCSNQVPVPQCSSPCCSENVPVASWNCGGQCGCPCDQQQCIQPPCPCDPCGSSPCPSTPCPCNPCASCPCPCDPCSCNPCGSTPCPCNPCPCNQCADPCPCAVQPCIKSVTRVANSCDSPHGPVLQSAVQSPLFPEPLVPVVENHVGHHLIKTVKQIPLVRKYCRPELVIRTRHVPVVKHRKRVFIEPYTTHIPITDKLIRQVIHQFTLRLPVIQKCVKPYTYQTVRHVPLSCAQCFSPNPPTSSCCQLPENQNCLNPLLSCNGPCPVDCDGNQS